MSNTEILLPNICPQTFEELIAVIDNNVILKEGGNSKEFYNDGEKRDITNLITTISCLIKSNSFNVEQNTIDKLSAGLPRHLGVRDAFRDLIRKFNGTEGKVNLVRRTRGLTQPIVLEMA